MQGKFSSSILWGGRFLTNLAKEEGGGAEKI